MQNTQESRVTHETVDGESKKTHHLKTDPAAFDAVKEGLKSCEIRFDDRDFKPGDILILRRTKYTGQEMKSGAPLIYEGGHVVCIVTHKIAAPIYGLCIGWCVLSIAKLTNARIGNADRLLMSDAREAATAKPCEKCETPTRHEVQVMGRLAAWCGCE